MIPIFEYFLKRVKKKAGIESPSLKFATVGAFNVRGWIIGDMSVSYQRATRFKRPYTLPRFSSWGLEYAPLSAVVCAYDNERFYYTDEPVSVLKAGANNAE